MMLRLLLAIALSAVILQNAFAQNRGAVRYVAVDDGDAPDRGTSYRRQRTTAAPLDEDEERPQHRSAYQEPPSTTGRRVPSRYVPAVPVEEQPLPVIAEEQTPSTKPPVRRRRPKKRRRPQPPRDTDSENQSLAGVSEPQAEPPADARLRSLHPAGDKSDSGPELYPPSSGTNRLPMGEDDNIRSYDASPQGDSGNRAYVPAEQDASRQDERDAHYAPVLLPQRNPADDPRTRHSPPAQDSRRAPPNRRPERPLVSRPQEVDVRPPEAEAAVRVPEEVSAHAHRDYDLGPEFAPVFARNEAPTNRLPDAPPSGYVYPANDGLPMEPHRRRQETVPQFEDSRRRSPNPEENSVRQPPPRYELPLQRPRPDVAEAPHRTRATSEDSSTRTRPGDSRTTARSEDSSTRTRVGSRYRPEEPSRISVPRPEEAETPTRSRIESNPERTNTRTRGSSRYRPETSSEPPTRPQEIVRTRGGTRHAPQSIPEEPAPLVRSRTGSRYQPQEESPARVPARDRIPQPPRRPPSAPETVRTPPRRPASPPAHEAEPEEEVYHHQRRPQPVAEEEEVKYTPLDIVSSQEGRFDDPSPIRNTLRSRPQFEPPQYEEPAEDPYRQEYQVPRQPEEYQSPRQEPEAPRQPQEYQPPRRETQSQREGTRQQSTRSRSHQEGTRQLVDSNRQYQAPQNPRSERPQSSRPKHEDRAPTRPTSGSRFSCPEPYGFFADPVQCDLYHECRNGTATATLCQDGLAFNLASAPKYLRCDSLRDVDCSGRPQLQEAQASANCPRRFGLYPNQEDCTKFFNCVDGVATEVQCPPALAYNDARATCDWADLVQDSCKTEDLLGFTCPEAGAGEMADGVYSRHPHPTSCQLHFTCIRGSDGVRRPRMLSCTNGFVFDPHTSSCSLPEDVPGCEDFYGPPPAKRTPPPRAEPEPEERPQRTRSGSRSRARN